MESEFSSQLQSQVFEVLSSNDNSPMEVLFSHLFSREQSQKSHAHAFFECSKRHYPDVLFIKLCFLIRCSPRVETRANAIRVVRFVRICDLWPKLREMAQSTLKGHFLAYLREESSMAVLRMFCVVMGETVREVCKGGKQWPELIEFVLTSLGKTNDEKLLETALLVLANLPRDCRSFICDALKGSIQVIHSSFLSGLASASPDVQVASFGAVLTLVALFSDPSNPGLFHDLLRAMMVGIFSLLRCPQDGYVHIAFKELINLVQEGPQPLRPYMSDMVLDMLQIAENSSLNEEIHCCALRLVISMTELQEFNPILLSLPHETLVRLFLVPMKMLLCVKEDMMQNELKSELDGNTGKINVYKFGLGCLYQLSITLGESKIVPIALELLPHYLNSSEWKMRHAGITMLTVLAKEFSFETQILMEDSLGQVLAKIIELFQDSHFQVRWAAFNFMVIPTTFVQVVQILYHSRLVLAFVAALDNEQNNKVKEQAASAMLFFLKNTLPDSLLFCQDVDIVMVKLLVLLQGNENAKDRSIVLSAFNIVAERSRKVALEHHVNYLTILVEACNDNNSEVKEEAARGIRICAELGSMQFKPFINRILPKLNILMQHPNQQLSENAKAHDIAVSVLGRICVCHRDCIDASKLVPAWLSLLPLKDDLNEAKLMHEQLCLMAARLDKELLGPGNQNLVKIIAVFVEVIGMGDKLATMETVKNMSNLLREFWRTIPRSSLELILLSFNSQQQDLLLSLVST
ncbi:importin-5-like [Senna tora]|uniref:Importin-5-like n=1 Tax=Senna tora TaxID=362788 RepID=A0A834WSS1_9FABA|nr:importin-5-like [Senna tora]